MFARMLRLHSHWIFPTLLGKAAIIHLRSLSTETIQLAHIARAHGIRTLCVPGASGSNGDAAHLPSSAVRELGGFDWISTLTPAMQAEIVGLGFPMDHTSVIPNGIDPVDFAPPEHPRNLPRVIFVGQFRPEKRIDILLQAWQQVQERHADAVLTLVGEQNRASYQQRAVQLGISPTFTSMIAPAQIPDQLRQHSIFVMPGTSEGMSNALLEAMAIGLAPVVSATPANCAVVQAGVNGLTYAVDSPSDLAAQLIRLLEDAALRKQLGAAARATVLQHYTLDRVATAYTDIYAKLLRITG